MDTILVVGDDTEIRDVIHVYLRNEGYFVIEAANGLEALDLIRSISFELVILDIMLPQMDGINAGIKIREISNTPLSCYRPRKKILIKLWVLLPARTIT